MVGWHHWLNGHEFKQAPGTGDGQGSLACCSPWGCKDSDTTERLNWTDMYFNYPEVYFFNCSLVNLKHSFGWLVIGLV